MLWYQKVLEKINLEFNRWVVVLDPDGVLQEESILGRLGSLGFDILDYTDPVGFRYVYESQFRYAEERKLLIRLASAHGRELPFDVVDRAVTVTLKLSDFFPHLSYPVLKQLPPAVISDLYQAYRAFDGGSLGDLGTREFVLQHVYQIYPGTITSTVQFLKTLFFLHDHKIQLPQDLAEFLEAKLAGQDFWQRFGGARLLQDPVLFWNLLQEQWRIFLDDLSQGTSNARVPFDHPDLRIYVDHLFLEGVLRPVQADRPTDKLPEWVRVGVAGYAEELGQEKLAYLTAKMKEMLEQEGISYKHWLSFAPLLAEAKVTYYTLQQSTKHRLGPEGEDEAFLRLYHEVEALFADWLLAKYGGLNSLSYSKQPVLVHHIPKFISYQRSRQAWERVALVVLDGMAWEQWLFVKKHLQQDHPFKLDERAAFAWIPTTTTVSRQAIFAGEPPYYFKDSLLTTSKEEQLWRRFWEGQGEKAFNVRLVKGLEAEDLAGLEQTLLNPKLRVLGLVIDKVDKMVHGQQLGTLGMYQDMELWLQGGFFTQVLNLLLEHGFKVFITSDHGNVAATGQGKLDQGVVVESKGERFRSYQGPEFLAEALEKTKSIEWPVKYGLPDNVRVLLAQDQSAYVAQGKELVSHGGISIEEVIVPFVRVGKEELRDEF